MAENWLGGHGGRGNGWSGVLYGLEMIGNAYLVFILEGSGLPLAMVAGWVRYIATCAGLYCLLYGVPKGHLFSSFPLVAKGDGSATWSILDVAAKFGT